MSAINEEALDKAAREGYAVRCKTNGPRTLAKYASDDIMTKQLADARVIVTAYQAALAVDQEVSTAEPVSDELGKFVPVDATPKMVIAALAIDWSNEDEEAVVHNIWHAMVAAALSHVQAPDPIAAPVQVKALEWYEHELMPEEVNRWHASPNLMCYFIDQQNGGRFVTIVCGWGTAGTPPIGSFQSLEAAKAAAQADYEQRIRSALVAAPSRDDVEEK